MVQKTSIMNNLNKWDINTEGDFHQWGSSQPFPQKPRRFWGVVKQLSLPSGYVNIAIENGHL